MKKNNQQPAAPAVATKKKRGIAGKIFLALLLLLGIYYLIFDTKEPKPQRNNNISSAPYISPPTSSQVTAKYPASELALIQSRHQKAKAEWLNALDSFARLYPDISKPGSPHITLRTVNDFAKRNLILSYMDKGEVGYLEEKPITKSSKQFILIMDKNNTFESDGDTLDFTAMYFHPKLTIFVKEKHRFSPPYKTVILAHELSHAIDNEQFPPGTLRAKAEMASLEFQFAVQSAIGGKPYEDLIEEEVRAYQKALARDSTKFPRPPYNQRLEKIFGPSLSDYETNLRRNMFHLQVLFRYFSTDTGYSKNKELAKLKYTADWYGIPLD